MKRLFALSFLVFAMVAGIGKSANAAPTVSRICFTDAYGYQYTINSITMTSMGKYSGTGTITNIGDYAWDATMTADFSSGTGQGTVEIHAINPQADNCASGFVDSFIYVGSATSIGTGYSGSGSWTNYCSGFLLNTGEWSASGPCNGALKSGVKSTKGSPAVVSGNTNGKKIAAPTVSRICFIDAYGYQYTINSITMTSMGKYSGTGTITNIGDYAWDATMTADFSSGTGQGTVEIHAINPQADNCASGFVDSFIYVGSATSIGTGYSGSGSWTNYCSGFLLNTGEWSASGPCNGALKSTIKKTDITPATSKKVVKDDKSSLKIVPNPATSFAQISYNVPTSGKVNITIYNTMQQPLKVLVNETKQAGNYTVSWNTTSTTGTPVLDGVYRVVAVVGNNQYTGTVQVSR